MNCELIKRNPRAASVALAVVVAIVATALETFRLRYANYLVFTDSTLDFWNGVSPYTQRFVDDHGRYFLYTPVFSVLYLPFALLPKWLGPFVWNLTNVALFTTAVFTLPSRYDAWKVRIYLLLLLILEQSVFCFQFNIVVAYVFLFAYSLMERGKSGWAVLLIMISATTKVYGIVQLLLLFCYPKVWRNLCLAVVAGLALLCLPALKVGLAGLVPCYMDWWEMLSQHQSAATFASLLYAWPLCYLLDHYRLVQIVTVAVVIAIFFLRHKRWNDFTWRATVLAVLMGWIIVFGDSSETHTYIIALAGYMLWYSLQERHTVLDRVLLWGMLIFFGVIPIDALVPSKVHHLVNDAWYVNVYLYAIAWCRMLWCMASQPLNPSTPKPFKK